MVRGLSKIIVIGNLGGDPEMRYTPNGDAVSNFSVAVNRRYRSREGETQEATEWFRVSAWGRMAEVSNQYLTKGSAVYVEGRFSTRRWTGQDGMERTDSEINANEVIFLPRGDADGDGGGGAYRGNRGGDDYGGGVDPDDLPF
jgi:single-strand DNA-binding protein